MTKSGQDIISRLSSQMGDKTMGSNIAVAEQCLKDTSLLKQIAQGLNHADKEIQADCAEVMTKVGEKSPVLIAPYTDALLPLRKSKYTRARWEAMHAIALIAPIVPNKLTPLLGELGEMMRKDKSTIVRDHTTATLAAYAGTSKLAAKEAMPYLAEILDMWGDKQAARVLNGLLKVADVLPEAKTALKEYALRFEDSQRGVARKAAAALLKKLNK